MQSIGRVRVFGETTMGQALPALFDKLPNGDVLIHAYGDFVTADGTRLEGRGVVPDEQTARSRAKTCSPGATVHWRRPWPGSTRRRHGNHSKRCCRVVRVGGTSVALPGDGLIDCVHLHDRFSSPHTRP